MKAVIVKFKNASESVREPVKHRLLLPTPTYLGGPDSIDLGKDTRISLSNKFLDDADAATG